MSENNLRKKLRVDENSDVKELKLEYEKLKQTYELIIVSSKDESIREIAKKKLEALKRDASEYIFDNVKVQTNNMHNYETVISAAYKLLESGKSNYKEIDAVIRNLNSIKRTSENYYLQAVLTLQKECGTQEYETAKKHIEEALKFDSNNEVYLEMHNGIIECLKRTIEIDERNKRILEEQNRQYQERQRKLAAEANAQRRRASCGDFCECVGNCFEILFDCLCCGCY